MAVPFGIMSVMLNQNQPEKTTSARVPWWQEPQVETPPPTTVVVPLSEEVKVDTGVERDLWDELEAEALQRSQNAHREVRIPLNHADILQKRRKSLIPLLFVLASLFTALMLFVASTSSATLPLSVWLVSLLIWAEAFIFSLVIKRAQKKIENLHEPNQVLLTPEGIRLWLIGDQFGTIYWHEIAEIKSYNVLGTRCIGIQPKNTKELGERFGGRAKGILAFTETANSPFKKMGFFLPPLNILAKALPMSPEEFLGQVAIIRQQQPTKFDLHS